MQILIIATLVVFIAAVVCSAVLYSHNLNLKETIANSAERLREQEELLDNYREEANNYYSKSYEFENSIVELHEKLPESYKTDGYRYIGMRFQNEIKNYIEIDEPNNRIILKVVKPKK